MLIISHVLYNVANMLKRILLESFESWNKASQFFCFYPRLPVCTDPFASTIGPFGKSYMALARRRSNFGFASQLILLIETTFPIYLPRCFSSQLFFYKNIFLISSPIDE